MKLSQYAKEIGVCYRTAWTYYKTGLLDAYQNERGTIIVRSNETFKSVKRVVIYCRVSSSENKDNLDSQSDRVLKYCTVKGYNVTEVIKEIGSGVNDNRKKLSALLEKGEFDVIVVEHKDRLTRFGFNYISTILKHQNKRIEVINEVEEKRDDLVQDFVSIITSFCARIYGLRRSKRKTEQLTKIIEDQVETKNV